MSCNSGCRLFLCKVIRVGLSYSSAARTAATKASLSTENFPTSSITRTSHSSNASSIAGTATLSSSVGSIPYPRILFLESIFLCAMIPFSPVLTLTQAYPTRSPSSTIASVCTPPIISLYVFLELFFLQVQLYHQLLI